MRSDSEVQQEVQTAIRTSECVDSRDIAVNVTNGTVALSGLVRDLSSKYLAEEAALAVAGVMGLANDIFACDTTAGARSDPEIARNAVAALRRTLPDESISVVPLVRQGCVTLQGSVDTMRQRELATEVVRHLDGVVCVVNSIALAPSKQTIQIEDVKTVITKSLQRLDAAGEHIKVEVLGSNVILRGRVYSWDERYHAEMAARAAPGVQNVRNELNVQLRDSPAAVKTSRLIAGERRPEAPSRGDLRGRATQEATPRGIEAVA